MKLESFFDEDTEDEASLGNDEAWQDEWIGMPHFENNENEAFKKLVVKFKTKEDVNEFTKMIDQSNITDNTRSIWYPQLVRDICVNTVYTDEDGIPKNPIYPVYIISKNRADTRLTSKTLEAIGVPYHIVIEPQEYETYAAVIDPKKILVLPFSNLGLGSIPARNWVWEHSISIGAKRHWILDDNIRHMYRMDNNKKYKVNSGTMMRIAEEFTDRYENVSISGFNYDFLCAQNSKYPPYYLNTRVYSCILIKNSIKHRWRGRYNEDTDLSIRVLKDGDCTILFNAFMCGKTATMQMGGGNTDELYKGTGRLDMAQSLVNQHPDIARISWKWDRWQHHVDYRIFKKNKLIRKPDWNYSGIDNNGLKLINTVTI